MSQAVEFPVHNLRVQLEQFLIRKAVCLELFDISEKKSVSVCVCARACICGNVSGRVDSQAGENRDTYTNNNWQQKAQVT